MNLNNYPPPHTGDKVRLCVDREFLGRITEITEDYFKVFWSDIQGEIVYSLELLGNLVLTERER